MHAGSDTSADGHGSRSAMPAASKARQTHTSLAAHDNWPANIPVTAREIEVIETYMSDIFDAILAQCKVKR